MEKENLEPINNPIVLVFKKSTFLKIVAIYILPLSAIIAILLTLFF